ncbi:MAG TPA: sulfatase [bacterium]|nr:sulfatase [bacterium]
MAMPNIIFILCDDLGVNDLHCYGREDHNTPNLDRLASHGVRFTSAYASQAICSASRAGLLTAMNPARLHLTTYLPGRPDTTSQRLLHPEIEMNVSLSVKTFPRYFKEAGYVTGFIGKWHIGRDIGPEQHGFDHVYHPGDSRNTVPSDTEGGKAEYELTREAINFIEKNREHPFVTYIGHYTPHVPYTACEHLIEKNKHAFEPVYAAVIETLDDTVGILVRKLEELNIADNTILVFTSDNGGLHVPEGGHTKVTHNTPYRAGKGHVYEGGQRIPLIVRWPGHIPEGIEIHQPVNNIDWIPTLLELAEIPVPPGLDGKSFAPGLTCGSFPDRKIFWHFPHYTNQGGRPGGAMRHGEWLLVEIYDENRAELYNLYEDIGETNDVSAQHVERVNSMRADLDAWRKENKVQHNTPNPDFNQQEYKELFVDVNPSKFNPLTADDKEWEKMRQWRYKMNAPWRNKKP